MHTRSIRCVPAQATDEIAVVDDVAVRQRGALGESRRTRRVLDVDRVVGRQFGLQPGQFDAIAGTARGQQLVPLRPSDQHHLPQFRAVRPHLLDHRRIVGRLERRCGHQQRDAGLSQDVLQLMRPVRRVDVDQDRADLRAAELQQRPLGHVWRPNADSVTPLDSRRQQAERDVFCTLPQLGVRPPATGLHLHQGLSIRLLSGDPVEHAADRVVKQRYLRGARRIGRDGGEARNAASVCLSSGPSSPHNCGVGRDLNGSPTLPARTGQLFSLMRYRSCSR